MNLQPGKRGCLCHSPTTVEVGAEVEMQRLLPCRAEEQQCQRWLQPEPEPLEMARELRYAGFMARLMMCLWLGWGSRRCCPALPCTARQVPALHPDAEQGGGSQMDFALQGGASRGSPWHRCRVCPLPGSSTAPSLFARQAATQQEPRGGGGGRILSGPVLSCPALALLWC